MPAAVGTSVEAKLGSAHVELWAAGKRLARHEQSYVRFAPVLELEHYLDVLLHKPGAMAGSTPLAQWRARSLWPASYDALWAQWMSRHGKQAGTRQLIGVLRLARTYGAAALQHAVETALTLGCRDEAAVRHLLLTTTLTRPSIEPIPIGAMLAHYDRPLPNLAAYDTLVPCEAGR